VAKVPKKQKQKYRRSKKPHKHQPEGKSGKRCPNGLTATIKAVLKNWNNQLNESFPAEMSVKAFLDDGAFAAAYGRVLLAYPGLPSDAPTDSEDIIRDLSNGTTDAEYYKLRAVSDYLGIPVGLLLAFSQFTSDEVHCKLDGRNTKEELLKLIGQWRNSLAVAESLVIEKSESKTDIFISDFSVLKEMDSRGVTSNVTYLGNASALKKIVDAFRQSGPEKV
jgi:hypothetical protein